MADIERDRFVALAFCRADLLFELDDDHDVVFAAGATSVLLGEAAEALSGRRFVDLIAESDRGLAVEVLEAARAQGRIDDVVVRLNGTGNRRPNVALAGYRVPDFDNHFFLALKMEPALQSERLSEAELKRDGESGLLDEASYAGLAAERAQSFRRAGGRPQITMVKVESLNEMTQALGASDRKRIMGEIGDILTRHSLGGGTAGRVGDEAFSYLHRDDVDPEEVSSLISDAARKLFNTEVKPHAHTLDADGAGLAEHQVARAIAHTIRSFSEKGDHALDKKKSLAQVLSGMVSDTIDNVAYIRRMVAGRDFDMAFMPICDLRLERVSHFEALTRPRDAKAGTSPYHLFSLAEEVGIVHELDMAIVETTIQTMNSLVRERGLMPPVAINLSGQSLSNPQFVEELTRMLRRSGMPPRKLMFELTESVKVEHLPEVNAVIQDLRRLGYRFCLDDFGSGAASFDYLNGLDVDIVKFDGPVVKRASSSQKGSDLLSSMTKMCASMGIRTVAEMVEDKRMAGRVYQCGVDFGQGYYFGKPDFNPFIFADRFMGGL
ncbi:EAL domain-containing protein [Magnetospirillum aberrantis]|uniref:EAL domain-containing protein n=1 Tax=Magnetospirillum aberrantis SpK TaxID=908842 RepID=A0A7C9QRC1_9PROT|nr:EAL domain-containing protein [Magnetospirillum aberrantis]NFV78723.1 EAL domain-containing protein [Magnetospirillum aberrantis SpK]